MKTWKHFRQRLSKEYPTAKITSAKTWPTGHWIVRFTINGRNMGVECPPSGLSSNGDELFEKLDQEIPKIGPKSSEP